MKRSAATVAIVTARLTKERRVLLLAVAACALLAYVQRYDDAWARLAGCLVFGTLIGIAVALLQRGAGRFRELELCEQSAPLFGRELARATALVPCIIVTFALTAYWIVSAVYLRPNAPAVALTAVAVYAGTLVALCAGVRSGAPRVLYIAMACAVPALAFLVAVALTPIVSVAACAAAAFVALRQYGEALARYDPI
ncbi:MAG TPA: hypothetical protein VKT72_10135 [Candidatus Baltobacteraceae bacterium]|nr:hypothetical protein [Candidatus Baltobacteraceae bacterium]